MVLDYRGSILADHATRRHVRHRRVGDASVPCPSMPGPNMTDVTGLDGGGRHCRAVKLYR